MNFALLLLAGSSNRFKDNTYKQFYLVNNKPLYYYPLKALNDSKEIDQIIVLTLKDKIFDVFNFVKQNNLNKVKAVIGGGNSRNETVKFGLEKIKETANEDDIVLIHDAARALLTSIDVDNAIKETKTKDVTTYALHSYDTLVRAKNFEVVQYLNRDEIFRIQTPQTFKFKLINNAYKNFKHTNDDTELVFLTKHKVHLLKGSERLFKVTTKEDIKKMETYLCATK